MDDFSMVLLSVLISTIPGIYLATKKHFLIIPNPKYDLFAVRLFYCVLSLIPLTLVFTLIPFGFILIVFFNSFPHLADEFAYLNLLCPLLSATSMVFLLKKYIVSADVPFELRPDFMDHELYVFTPHAQLNGVNSNYLRTYAPPYDRENFVYPKKRYQHKELIIGKQIGDLVLNFKYLNKINYLHTGEFVVSEDALEIFQKKNLTGYQTQPVSNSKKSSSDSDIQYHQIISLHTMPAFSLKTVVQSETHYTFLYTHVLNDNFYYKSSVMDNVFDFNVTSEILGSNAGNPYYPQRLWIVSKKAMRVLLKEFDLHKRDFIPITLVDDENNETMELCTS